jgi:uncharacterized repeat protein (TIGR02543 family)
MFKKRNLLFLSLLILMVLLVTSCLPKPPITEGILKGQVIVPEGTIRTKDLTGQALPDATLNIIDLATGEVIATTLTDADGYYQVLVPPGGPYLLQAIKDGLKVQQLTPQVEAGIEYDLGTADCVTTTVALIVQAMLEAEDYPDDLASINLTDIEADPDFDEVSSIVCSIIQSGGNPTESEAIEQAVEGFLYPSESSPSPSPTPTYTVTFDSQGGSAVNSQTVEQGGKVSKPTDPTKTGFVFNGWYKESGCTNAWNFASDTVTTDVTLYAQWMDLVHNITQDIYYAAIQPALTAADSGDIIEVADGTYTETIRFDSAKIIILRSVNGPSSTTIIGDDNFGTVICTNDSPDGTTLEGFTITHDTSDNGRGITNNGFLTVNNCIISNNQNGNTGSTWGGGIGNSGTLTITDSTIDHNFADNGGAIVNYDSGILTITGSTINNNSSIFNGGGINNEGTLTINGSTISHNTVNLSGYTGGGIYNKNGTLTITGNTINNNSADRGGAIEIYGGTTTIGGGDVSDYNIICGNTTDGTCTIINQIYPDTYPNNYICVDCACGFAALRNLSVSLNDAGIGSILEQPFDCNTTSYTAIVTNDIVNIYITPIANCSGTTITVNGEVVNSGSISGAISLDVGENLVTIIVTSKDGITTETYTVTVTRSEF